MIIRTSDSIYPASIPQNPPPSIRPPPLPEQLLAFCIIFLFKSYVIALLEDFKCCFAPRFAHFRATTQFKECDESLAIKAPGSANGRHGMEIEDLVEKAIGKVGHFRFWSGFGSGVLEA